MRHQSPRLSRRLLSIRNRMTSRCNWSILSLFLSLLRGKPQRHHHLQRRNLQPAVVVAVLLQPSNAALACNRAQWLLRQRNNLPKKWGSFSGRPQKTCKRC